MESVADVILNSLTELFVEAQHRGLSLDTSYLHFDRFRQDLVGVDAFHAAIQELQVVPSACTSDDVAECMRTISWGKSTEAFKKQDFLAYFQSQIDSFRPQQSSPDATIQDSTTNRHKRFCQVEESSKHSQTQRETIQPTQKLKKLDKNKKRPLPVTLPAWAHERSKRALRELENLSRKRRPQLEESGALSSNRIEESELAGSVQESDLTSRSTARSGVEHTDRSDSTAGGDSQCELSPSKAFPAGDHASLFPASAHWKLLQIDADTTISYLILSHTPFDQDESEPTPNVSTTKSALFDAVFNKKDDPKVIPFRLTIFLDFFQTLESLELFFRPFLTHFPQGKVLLCGFPTRCSAKQLLTNEFLSRCYGKLLRHLISESRAWLPQPKSGPGAVAQYLIGFGSGASVALHLSAIEAPLVVASLKPSDRFGDPLELFLRSLSALVLVNGNLHPTDHSRSILNHLVRGLKLDCKTENVEALASALFSDFYLTQTAKSRLEALEKFYATHPGFLELPNTRFLHHALLGLIKNVDMTAPLANLLSTESFSSRILLVHGTQNALFGPWMVESFVKTLESAASLLSAQVTKFESLDDCLFDERENAMRLHLSWLKSGHELLQERESFVCTFLAKLVTRVVRQTTRKQAEENENQVKPDQATSGSRASGSGNDNDKSSSGSTAPFLASTSRSPTPRKLTARRSCSNQDQDQHQGPPVYLYPGINQEVLQLLKQHGVKYLQQELYDRGMEGSGTEQEILERFQQVTRQEKAHLDDQQRKDELRAAKNAVAEAEKKRKQQEADTQKRKDMELDLVERRIEASKQHAFFDAMEQKKQANLQTLLENELMALEDALSLKYEEQTCKDQVLQAINEQALVQVQELADARREQEKQRREIQDAEERLKAQQLKRQELKRLEKEFETSELFCGGIELYHLDAPAKLHCWQILCQGSTQLTKDFELLRAFKSEKMSLHHDMATSLEETRAQLQDRELALRNLKRVITKAQTNGTIAKAGLGNVRIVPISAKELGELQTRQQELEKDINSLHSEIAIKGQAVAQSDKELQRLVVLIKRNDGFVRDRINTIERVLELGDEAILSLREDLENVIERFDKNETTAEFVRKRIGDFEHEKENVLSVDTEYFDSTLRVAGSVQRVKRTQRLSELDQELAKQRSKLDQLDQDRKEMNVSKSQLEAQIHEHASHVFELTEVLTVLRAVIDPSKTIANPNSSPHKSGKQSPNRDARTKQLELFEENQSLAKSSLAMKIRLKKNATRSLEEKHWIALDFIVNYPIYYKHLSGEELESIRLDTSCQQHVLKKEDIDRILGLPARVNLALPFLKSKEELDAHFLLRKYTFEDGEAYFANLDEQFSIDNVNTGVKTIVRRPAVVLTKLNEVVAALNAFSGMSNEIRGTSVLLRESDAEHQVVLKENERILTPHKSLTHTFRLPKQVATLSLAISIVFQGQFGQVGYKVGRLAGMLYVLPRVNTSPNKSSSASDEAINAVVGLETFSALGEKEQFGLPLPIGKCFYDQDIAVCTAKTLGKLVLRHDPINKPLAADALYQLVLGSPVATNYSVEIQAKTAKFARDVLQEKRMDALKKQELLPIRVRDIAELFLTMRLSERKRRLAKEWARKAKELASQKEQEMVDRSKELDKDNQNSQLGHEQRKLLLAQILEAEKSFTSNCFLFASREKEADDIEASLKELTRMHCELLEQSEQIEANLVLYREQLPLIATALTNDDAHGARIARELNIEYVGPRSSRVRWAELSAMKAKLPSMMTPVERLRRKYKKGVDELEKKEREWILLDRILHPELYTWESKLVDRDGTTKSTASKRLKLHGTIPTLSKDEIKLAVLSRAELERILEAPWNLLQTKEIKVRKVIAAFRDDKPQKKQLQQQQQLLGQCSLTASFLRRQKLSDLTPEEKEWLVYDKILNPSYHPVNVKTLSSDLLVAAHGKPPAPCTAESKANRLATSLTREDLLTAINTVEEELFKLPNEVLKARNLLLKYDSELTLNVLEARRQSQMEKLKMEQVEMDVDARSRLVYQELERAIANTSNEFMDSSVLHSTVQRFPTKVLRVELEKELDRLLMGQIHEKEQFELQNLFKSGTKIPQSAGFNTAADHNESDSTSISDSDSDEEAVIAREKKEQRKRKGEDKKLIKAKARGKTNMQKSLMKQRRQIKDQLLGRSLQEERLLLQQKELGKGGCMACRTNPCSWKPYLQESIKFIESRLEVLAIELERVKRCEDPTLLTCVSLSGLKSGSHGVLMRKDDLFDELTFEIKIWEKNLRLKAIDQEFHDTFQKTEPFFETKALHGFAQVQLKEKIQVALQREHNLLVANLTAYEVVEDVLEYMLEGWVFGDRDSSRQVLGYVPSLKKEGPLTMYDLRRLDQERQTNQAKEQMKEEETIQGTPFDKWKPIEMCVAEQHSKQKAVKKGSQVDSVLNETENAFKFGFFTMTLMYFRGLSLLKKQKSIWSTSIAKPKDSGPEKTAEKLQMESEANKLKARDKRASFYNEKAQKGQARRQKLQQERTEAYRQRLIAQNKKAKREHKAAIEIQRIYRGHLGKIAGKRWMVRRREIDAQRALEQAAAVTLQRAYRGRLGRLEAEEKRVELAEYISQIRAEEAVAEEEEYWRTHRMERLGRKFVAFVKKQA